MILIYLFAHSPYIFLFLEMSKRSFIFFVCVRKSMKWWKKDTCWLSWRFLGMQQQQQQQEQQQRMSVVSERRKWRWLFFSGKLFQGKRIITYNSDLTSIRKIDIFKRLIKVTKVRDRETVEILIFCRKRRKQLKSKSFIPYRRRGCGLEQK